MAASHISVGGFLLMSAGPEGKCVCNFLHSCQRGVRADLAVPVARSVAPEAALCPVLTWRPRSLG